MFYGCSDLRPDGSYIATEWFAVIYLPVLPLRSIRILEVRRQRTAGGVPGLVNVSSNLQYQMLSEEPLAWKQIFKTAILGWGTAFVGVLFVIWLRRMR
jgi:hypothetical protein